MAWPVREAGASANDYLTDSFGRNYTGVSTGQIRSAGPDGIANNSDDIVYPPSVPVLLGDVTVAVKTITGGKTVVDPTGYRVESVLCQQWRRGVLERHVQPFQLQQRAKRPARHPRRQDRQPQRRQRRRAGHGRRPAGQRRRRGALVLTHAPFASSD